MPPANNTTKLRTTCLTACLPPQEDRRVLVASRIASTILGALVATLLLLAAGPSTWLPTAEASGEPNCFTSAPNDYGAMTVIETTSASNTDAARQMSLSGVRSNAKVGESAQCQRINSLFVWGNGGTSLYEFGYSIGWISCFNDGAGSFEYHSNPTLFAVAFESDGTRFCKIWSNSSHPVAGGTDGFRASDENENTYWGGWWNGTQMQPDGWNLDFAQGYGGVNTERANPADNGYAKFADIHEVINQTWSPTDYMARVFDYEPTYHLERPNGYTVKVVGD